MTTGPDTLRVRLTAEVARAFVNRGHRGGRRGSPALPAVRPAARSAGPHLPAPQRPLRQLTGGLPRWRPQSIDSRCRPRGPARGRDRDRRPDPGLDATTRCSPGSTRPARRPRSRSSSRRVYKPTAGERPLDDFPDETLSPPRGRRVPRQRGDGLGDRAADGPPRRAVRRRGAPALDRRRPDRSTSWRWSSGRPAAAADRGLRRGGQQHRPEGRPPPAGCGRARLRRRPRGRFSTVPKLRTVLWGWRGRPFAADELDGLARLADALRGDLARDLAGLLSRGEIAATRRRVDGLLETRRFPLPAPTGRRSPGRRSDRSRRGPVTPA